MALPGAVFGTFRLTFCGGVASLLVVIFCAAALCVERRGGFDRAWGNVPLGRGRRRLRILVGTDTVRLIHTWMDSFALPATYATYFL